MLTLERQKRDIQKLNECTATSGSGSGLRNRMAQTKSTKTTKKKICRQLIYEHILQWDYELQKWLKAGDVEYYQQKIAVILFVRY